MVTQVQRGIVEIDADISGLRQGLRRAEQGVNRLDATFKGFIGFLILEKGIELLEEVFGELEDNPAIKAFTEQFDELRNVIAAIIISVLPVLTQFLEQFVVPALKLVAQFLQDNQELIDEFAQELGKLFAELGQALLPIVIRLLEALLPLLEFALEVITKIIGGINRATDFVRSIPGVGNLFGGSELVQEASDFSTAGSRLILPEVFKDDEEKKKEETQEKMQKEQTKVLKEIRDNTTPRRSDINRTVKTELLGKDAVSPRSGRFIPSFGS